MENKSKPSPSAMHHSPVKQPELASAAAGRASPRTFMAGLAMKQLGFGDIGDPIGRSTQSAGGGGGGSVPTARGGPQTRRETDSPSFDHSTFLDGCVRAREYTQDSSGNAPRTPPAKRQRVADLGDDKPLVRSLAWQKFADARKLNGFRGKFNTKAWSFVEDGSVQTWLRADAGDPNTLKSVSEQPQVPLIALSMVLTDPDPVMTLGSDAIGCCAPPHRRQSFVCIGDNLVLFEGTIECSAEQLQSKDFLAAKLIEFITGVGPEAVAAVLTQRSAAMTEAWGIVKAAFPGTSIMCTNCSTRLEPFFFNHVNMLPWVHALMADAAELSVFLSTLERSPRGANLSAADLAAMEEAVAADLFKEFDWGQPTKRLVMVQRLCKLQPVLRRLTGTAAWAGVCGTGEAAEQRRERLAQLINTSDFFQRTDAYVRWNLARRRFARYLLWNYV